ncbi:carboxymuconolactone decarboxylase family protein [Streptomyces chiangmaiensis]|uniref:Carboxymuconolactone decarboxylase family protein n=1 Tax=Streptomyces chiangmaiensis TaxID=766497 RepID=A0ABU7FST4_9ACTN|nr:carboxymuconolactone decarboxylase family protein [Streptomyces chiangmaiensis]MED7827129.1 carboxymuconolactone decarboxylase family protein [Streptomyces chiangmaiensis]
MEARFNFTDAEFGRQFFRKFGAAALSLYEAPLAKTVQELVKIRASQINSCAACTDMHTKDALASGETQQRLNLVAVWREATVFTEAERAALALTEQGTRLADTRGVDDTTWEAARKHFDDEELAALIALIAVINAFNRFNVIVRNPAGDYTPGQYA